MLSSAALETPKSHFCCLLGGAVTAAAAPARADALIVSLLVLPTHTVSSLHIIIHMTYLRDGCRDKQKRRSAQAGGLWGLAPSSLLSLAVGSSRADPAMRERESAQFQDGAGSVRHEGGGRLLHRFFDVLLPFRGFNPGPKRWS